MAQITVFKDSNMSGTAKAFTSSVKDLKEFGFNDSISSLVATAGTWRLWQNTNFGGDYWDVSPTGGAAGTDAYPNWNFWGGKNDSISSIELIG